MDLPDVLVEWPGGEIMVKGHRIALQHVVRCYREGMSTIRIVEEFDTLSPYQVNRVIEFYVANRADVDRYITRIDVEIERQMAETPPSPALERIRELMQRREAERRAECA